MKLKYKIKKISFYLSLFICFIAIQFSGCGVYEDFTTYFNTYYNASVMFDEALIEVAAQEKELFNENVSAQQVATSSKFVGVIEKCSKILQFNQNSSFVDDALFMIGKSYYYQREYPSSIRKFNELISNFSKSKYYLEALLWVSKSQINMNEFKVASAGLKDLIKMAKEKDDEDILADAYLELLKIDFINKDYESFVQNGKEFLKYCDDERASQVLLQMGIYLGRMDKNDEALSHLERVKKFSPTYKTSFRAGLEKAKIKRILNHLKEASDILDNLKSNINNEEFYDQIELERGFLLMAEKSYQDAIDQFRYVDTVYTSKESAGIAQFQIASYLENTLNNFDSAKYFYDRSAVSSAPKEITALAQKKSQLLTKRKTINENINNLFKRVSELRTFRPDTLNLPPKEVFIDSTKLSDSIYLKFLEREQSTFQIADSIYYARKVQDTINFNRDLRIADSISADVYKYYYDLGLFYFTEYDLPDSSYFYFKLIADSLPSGELAVRAKYALASYYDSKGDFAQRDSLYKDIYSSSIKSEIKYSVAKKLKLEIPDDSLSVPPKLFAEAEKEMFNKNYNSAIKKLWKIRNNYSWSDYAPKSMLTIGYIYEVYKKNYDSAAIVYDSLQKAFPVSVFAKSIYDKLSAYNAEKQRIEEEKKQEEARKKAEEEAKKQELEKKKEISKQDSVSTNGNLKKDKNGKKPSSEPDNLIKPKIETQPPDVPEKKEEEIPQEIEK